MKLQNLVLFIFASFILSTNVHSQSLDVLLEIAKENNLELKILKNEYLAALEKAPQVSQGPEPELGIGSYPLPVETRLGAQLVRLSATQMLPWPGLLNSKKELELAKAKTLYKRMAAKDLDLSFEVKKAYYKLYEIKETQTITQQNISIIKSLERIVLAKVETGKASAADVLQVQLKIEELKQELNILETTKRIARADINQLLNRHFETPIIVKQSFSFTALAFNKDSLTNNIKADHPALQMIKSQQDVSKQAISLNALNGKPSFGIGVDYILVKEREFVSVLHNGRDILQVRAAIKIPIFRKKYQAKDREENFKIKALDFKKEELLSRFNSAIEKAFAKHRNAQLKLDLYQQQIKITKAAIQILETAYSTQGRQFDELLQLEKDLINYDLKILKAVVQSLNAKAEIERFIIQ